MQHVAFGFSLAWKQTPREAGCSAAHYDPQPGLSDAQIKQRRLHLRKKKEARNKDQSASAECWISFQWIPVFVPVIHADWSFSERLQKWASEPTVVEKPGNLFGNQSWQVIVCFLPFLQRVGPCLAQVAELYPIVVISKRENIRNPVGTWALRSLPVSEVKQFSMCWVTVRYPSYTD